jgi:hypothetical protein
MWQAVGHRPRALHSAARVAPERVNDFAPPFVMNLLRKVVVIDEATSFL